MTLLRRISTWLGRSAGRRIERSAVVEEVEPRILYSADLNPALWAGGATQASAIVGAVNPDAQPATSPAVAAQLQQRQRHEIVFVDAAVPDAQKLIDSVTSARPVGTVIEFVQLSAGTDGLTQIGEVLANERDLDAIHIISHGSDGALEIGNARLDAARLAVDAESVARWGQALSADGDLFLYGCEVAQGAAGQAFVQNLAQLTGADVAASTDKTGSAILGGDWNFEFNAGLIEAPLALNADGQMNWQGVLPTLTQRVGAASDDAEQEGPTGTTPNRMWLDSSDIELISDFQSPSAGEQMVGLRFTGINIPVGATITDAYLVFRAVAADSPMTNSGATNLTLRGQLIGDAPTFTTTSGNISSRTLTSASAAWAPTAWTTGQDYNSAAITSVVQEIVNQGTWASGNDLAIIITGTGHRASQAYDTDPSTAAQLVVTYEITTPVITNLAGDALTYINGSGAVLVDQGMAATVTDANSTDFDTGTLTVAIVSGGDAAEDVLAIRNQGTGAGQIGVSGANVTYAGTTIGTWAGGSGGGNLVITLNANANSTNAAALIQNITYQNTDAVTPTGGARTVRFVLNDGDGQTSANTDATVNVSGVANTLVVTTNLDTAGANDGDTSSIAALIANKGTDNLISLREAITAANNTLGTDFIQFNIAGAGPHTINLATALPTIGQALVIDGLSEPDYAGTPVVRIDGAAAGFSGLSIGAGGGGSTIRGLTITGFTVDGINVASGANNVTIADNWIGTAGTGTSGHGNANVGNSDDGIEIAGSNALILRNVITNNNDEGIDLKGSGVTGHVIQGNIIGLDPDGSTFATGNNDVGIAVYSGSGNTIGGTTAAARNVISKNNEGIEIRTSDNVVQGNYFGTDVTGTLPLGNRIGSGVQVQNSSTNNLIGGTALGAGNLIAFNAGNGVDVVDGSGHLILGNAIHSNTLLGINLGAAGVTNNDSNDADGGANSLQNFPVLSSVAVDGTQVVIAGTLNGEASKTYRVEFFANTANDNEGQRFLGFTNVTTPAGSPYTIGFTAALTASVAAGEYITATATDPSNNTSEFSAQVAAASGMGIWANNNTTPVFAQWNGSGFGSTANSQTTGEWAQLRIVEAPTRNEIIAVGMDTAGVINGQIWNGSAWSAFSFNNLVDLSTTGFKSFQLAYEQQSGDALLVWDNGSTGTASLSYRTWNGTSWSAAQTITTPVSGEAVQLSLAADPNSDSMVLAVGGTPAANDYALVWNGTSWGNAVTLDTTTGVDRTEIQVAYEAHSGQAVVVYDADSSTNAINYRTWDGTSWSAQQSLPAPAGIGAGSDANFSVMASDPNSDRLALAVITDSSEIWISVWDGSAWTSQVAATTTAAIITAPSVGLAFEHDSGDLLAAYGKSGSNTVFYRTWTSAGGWTAEATGPNVGGVPNSVLLYADPNSNRIMLGVHDNQQDVNFVEWTGSAWNAVNGDMTSNTGTSGGFEPLGFVWYDNNRTPVIGTTDLSMAENGTLAGSVASSDADGDARSYSIVGGADQAKFTIDSGTGALSFVSAPDFENPTDAGADNVYDVIVQVADGKGGTDSEAIAVTVTNVNEAPVVTTSGSTLAYTENGAAAAVDGALTVSDVDSATLTGATVSISANYAIGQDVLAFTNQLGITGSWNAGTGVMTLSGTTTLANYQTALRSITYVNTLDDPGTATRTVSFVVNDGAANSNSATRNVSVTAVNDAPLASNLNAAETYTEDTALNLTDIVISDVDSASVTATLTLSNTAAGSLNTGTSGAVTSTYNAGTGAWTASGAIADVNALLAGLTFTPAANFNSNFTIATSVSDGVAAPITGSKVMTGTAVNDAPLASNLNAAETYTEDTALNLTDIVISDVDSASVTATLTLSNAAAGSLNTGTSGAVTSMYNAGTGVWTASGALADVNVLLAGLTFTPAANFNSNFTISTSVSDGVASPVTGSKAMTGSAVNDAPSASNLSAAETYTEDTPLNLTDIVISDVDSANVTATLTLSNTAAGNLNTGTSGAVTSTYNAGTGVWTASGAIANVNVLLAGLTFTPASNFNSNFTISTSVSDGVAAPVTGSKTMTGTAVNDAPVVGTTGSTLAYTENGAATAVDAALTLSDVDNANLSSATITISAGFASAEDTLAFTDQNGISGSWNAGTGVLTLTGSASVANYQNALRSISYVNSSDNPNTTTRTVSFVVNDGSANSNTGTRNISITAVNDAPVITSNGGGASASISVAENGTAVTTATSSDVDGGAPAYSILAGGDAAKFTINTSTGVLSFIAAPDHENPSDLGADNVYNLTLQVSDGSGGTDTQVIAVTVTDVADGIRVTPISVAPIGGETRVNTNTGDIQTINPNVAQAIATDAAGNFVVVWSSNLQDGDSYGIYAQRYSADGTPLGAEFRVNTTTVDNQNTAVVAMDAAGNFVVAWASNLQDGSGYGISAQRFNAAGVAQGSEFLVNSTTALSQTTPSIAMSASGAFVITWTSGGQDPDASSGIYAQRFDASGVAQGSEFRVNTYTTNTQQLTSVGMDAAGNFVVIWASLNQDDGASYGVYGQRYNAAGVAQGAEFRVNTTIADSQLYHDVAMLADGRFAVVFQSRGAGPSYEVYVQRYAADGSALGSETRVNTTTVTTYQPIPSISADASGNLTVVWRSPADGAGDGVIGRRLDWSGTPLGAEFQVNSTTAGDQGYPEVVSQPGGGFIVAWSGNGPGDADGVFFQRYGLTTTEAGGTATFSVVLEAAPTGDVVISVSVPDGSEGSVVVGSLTFTTANWNIAQIVTVTGVQDYSNDGNTLYTVVLGTATSSDPNFNGLNPADVSVVNLEVPNVAPVNSVPGDQSTDEDTVLVFSTANGNAISISDADAGSGIVNVLLVATNGTITLNGTTGLSFISGDGSGDALLNFTGTIASINVALNGLVFAPTAGYSGAASLQIVTGDMGNSGTGGSLADSDPVSITVNPVNDAPAASNLSAAETYTEDTPLNLTDIVISDVDSASVTATLTLSNTAAGSLNTGTSGAVTSTYNAGTGVWSASGAVADVNALLAGLMFTPAANFNSNFTIATSISDGVAAPVTGSKAMTGTAVNDAPSASNLSAAETYTEDTALNLTDIVISDIDSASVTATLTLSNTAAGSLNTGTSGAVTSTYNAGTGVWTASGAIANVNALLAGLTFTPAANFNGNFTIATSVSDGVAAPVTGSKAMTGTAVNDAPTLGNGTLASVAEDTASPAGQSVATIFTGQFADVDAGASFAGIAVLGNTANAGTQGTWQYSTNAGSNWFVIGTVADGATALALSSSTLVRFVPVADYNGTPPALVVRGLDDTYMAGFSTTAGSETRVNVNTTTNGGTTAIAAVTANLSTTITAVNDAPVITSSATVNAAENQTGAITVTSTDVDGGAPSYSITGGADASLFTINATTGVLTFNAAPNFEAPTDAGGNNVYDVTVQVADGNGGTASQAIAITVTNVNEAPVITSSGTATVAENQTGAITVTSTDVDGGAPSYSITGGADAALFTINATTGALTFNAAPNFEAPTDAGGNNVYDVTVQVADGNGGTASQSIAITVTNVNEAPVITSSATVNAAENQTAAITVTSTDVDGGAPSYSVTGGADSALFTINATTGVLTFNAAPNFEAPADAGGNNVYDVTVQVSDGNGGTASQAIAVTVTNVNEAPVITSAATVSAAENQTSAITVTSTDVDGGTAVYSITGGADQTLFSINASTGVLTFNAAPNFEAPADTGGNNVYDVTVQVADGNGGTASQAIAVTVTNANEAPVITSDGGAATAAVNAAENQTAVTTVTSTDVDGGTAVYTITGGADQALFSINSTTGALTFNAAPNFESPIDAGGNNVYDVTVQVSDGNGGTDTQAIVVTVTSLNDNAPVITSHGGGVTAAVNVAENSAIVTTVSASDADLPAQTLTYSISGGVDAARFAIDASTGVLSFVAAPDHEAPTDAGANNVYDVIVQVSDGTFTDTQAITVTVTSLNDNAPAITSNGGGASAVINVAEDTSVVTTVTAADADLPAQTLTYSISGGADAARFTIDAGTGALRFLAAPDFEAPGDSNADNVYDVVVQVSDGNGGTDTQAIAVTVTNTNSAPTLGNATLAAVSEDSANPAGQSLGALFSGQFADADGGASLAGVAVVANSADAATQGSWQYSTDGGAGWYAIGAVADDATALALSNATLIRFLPARDFNGSPSDLILRSLDDTYAGGFSSTAGAEVRANVDAAVNGGSTPIAATAATLATSITPVNDAPVVAPVTLSAIAADSGGRLITQAELLAQASDVDGPGLTANGLAIVAGSGNLVDNGDGSWTYSPAAADASAVQFAYSVSDGGVSVPGSALLDIVPNLVQPAPAPPPAPDPQPTPPPPAVQPGPPSERPNFVGTSDPPVAGGTVVASASAVAQLTPAAVQVRAQGDDAQGGAASTSSQRFHLRVRDGGADGYVSVSFDIAALGEVPLEVTASDLNAANGSIAGALRNALLARRDASIEAAAPEGGLGGEPTRPSTVGEILQDPVRMASATFTAGFVWWLTRSGGLLTTMLMGVPAWRHVDLLPVLATREDDDEDDNDDSTRRRAGRASGSGSPGPDSQGSGFDDSAIAELFARDTARVPAG